MRLIDADALCEYANNLIDKTVDANDIMRFPRVDAVSAVRCRECIWHNERGNRDGKGYCQRPRLRGTSDRYGYCYGSETPADWYCADGKQKEDTP
jgi:hypothetical protein